MALTLTLSAQTALGTDCRMQDACDLNEGVREGRLESELVEHASECSLFAPIQEPKKLVKSRHVCMHSFMDNFGTEMIVAKLLEASCLRKDRCVFKVEEKGVRALWTSINVTIWAGRAHSSKKSQCPCSPRRPIPANSPQCPQLVFIRDPRLALAGHDRRASIRRGGSDDDSSRDDDDDSHASNASDKLSQYSSMLRRAVGEFEKTVLRPFRKVRNRKNPPTSTLMVRYESLHDPRLGFGVLRQIDKFLGLPQIREVLRSSPMTDFDARAILQQVQEDACMGEKDLGLLNVSTNKCEATLSTYREALSRGRVAVSHAPWTKVEDLVGAEVAAILDEALNAIPLFRSLFGCFRPPPCATIARKKFAQCGSGDDDAYKTEID